MAERADPRPPAAAATPGPAPQPMLFCPNCSRRLLERGCKLRCPGCGYYMSCADYV